MEPQKALPFLPIIVGAVALLAIVASVFFFLKNQSLTRENKTLASQQSLLQTQATSLKDEKAQLEKDLIFYKSTDLAKELEIVNLKLDANEKELKDGQKNLATTEGALQNLRKDVSAIPKMTEVLTMMTDVAYGADCFNDTDKAKTKQALKALGDSVWLDRWETFANDAKAYQCTMSPTLLKDALDYGFTKISETVK